MYAHMLDAIIRGMNVHEASKSISGQDKLPAYAVHAFALGLVLLLVSLQLINGRSPLKPSLYDTYTRQAMAWREGSAQLKEDVPHLELAQFEGGYYVSFPPVPSAVIFPFTFIFGAHVPDALLQLSYALIAYYAIVRMFGRHHWPPLAAASFAFLALTAGSMLPMLLTGAVWYHAQALAFTLTLLAIERMDADSPTAGLLCYALAVGCRPFNALYGPLLLPLYMLTPQSGKNFRNNPQRLLPGLFLGLMVAVALGWYNHMRFGNVLEFGHNHLPEFSFQGGQQFAIAHIAQNARTFLLGSPVVNENGYWHLHRFGFSMFLANPLFLCLLGWVAADTFRGRFTGRKGAILCVFLVHLLLLLSHRTFGGYQYGARYTVDCLPYALLYLLENRNRKAPHTANWGLLAAGLALAIWGSISITLPG